MPALKNKKHELLCQEYLLDMNQTQAAIRAGYSPKSANQQASELFAKPNICTRVAELMAERSKRTGVNADRVIRELARVAFVQANQIINMEDATLKDCAVEDDIAAVSSVKVKSIPTADGTGYEREIRLNDKIKALELLGKHLGMFTDKLELSGDVGVQIIDDIPDTPDKAD